MNPNASNRFSVLGAFALGLAALVWVGWGFVGTSAIALAMTLAIGAGYLLGAQEVRRFRAVTAALAEALQAVPQPLARLSDWLEKLPPALQNPVRARIEGERAALPGLALTPYLIGLLVMLGMLGTFLGLVVTFRGAVFTLEGTADLQAIRSALAEPIKGLGLAFGTSVVGVATSAMLGLMSVISRRERLAVVRELDARTANVFRPFSLAHQRSETFKALQEQAGSLPTVVDRLQTLMEQMERRGQQLDEQLLARQAEFHREARTAYHELGESVARSLGESLSAGARIARDTLQPVVENAMAAVAADAASLHERVFDAVRSQTGELLTGVQHTLHLAQADQAQALAQSATLWREELATLRREERARGEAAVQRLGEWQTSLNAQVATHLGALGSAIEAPVARLLEASLQAPRAAAELIAQLKRETTGLGERDQRALQERVTLMNNIDSLLQTVQQATGAQHAAIESLVASAGSVLDQVGRQFTETVGAQAGRAEDVAAQVSGSAIELAALGEAFGHGVQLFAATNEKLIGSLQRMEAAVGQSMQRSDEQLAYYVAQAREVIDLSLSSQQGIVEDLRRLRNEQKSAAESAA
ncbi:MAG: hypothetical protein QUV35_12805 [Hydrogenophaga sp.]|uniref:hypothetical protein n=1 Tax=Hydrogenophaga sp. TaxID=1904254 RepID=UPI00260BE9B4|nr:hypothetical protein [Hydrogenophaga sp.]MDM7943498.1 hypothetical protein [Hydrogenophaga sp.]